MMKRICPVALFFICVLLFAGCFPKPNETKNIENALLLEPVDVSDADMKALQSVYNFPEPSRRVAVVFGYGYNDATFVDNVVKSLAASVGLAQSGGAVVPLVFPDDFGRGGAARISMLSSMLKELGVAGLVLVGAPEGTHRVLANMQDSGDGSIGYPVFSLMPQDDLLGMEAACDLVLEYLPTSVSETDFDEEGEVYRDNVPELIVRSVQYMLRLPAEVVGGLERDLNVLTLHARQLAGSEWSVSQYIDPETGIRPQNHFVIESASIKGGTE